MRIMKIAAVWISVVLFVPVLASAKGKPVGSPDAVKGGQINLHTASFPKSFNYLINPASDASEVFGLVYDTLMEVNPNTLEFEPLLAKSWEISGDKKTFTVRLDPDAKWTDGKPVTADDVLFTYQTIMNPSNMTSVQRLFLSRFREPEVLDKMTVRFTAKTVHYNNLVTIAGFNVLPKHLFAGRDFNKSFNLSLPSGSGPYSLSEVKEGRYYVLKRNKNYWGDKLPHRVGTYNFEAIKFKVIRDDSVAFEAFKKGDFDFYNSISAKRWVTQTGGDKFRNNWIVKHKVFNNHPEGFAGIALNMRKEPFNDIRVRKALFLLLDRKTLLDKIMFNEYKPLDSYWQSLYGPDEVPNPPVKFDPIKAKELLRKAGYTKLDKDGFLIGPSGKRLEFSLYYTSPEFEKHFTYYADTLKQAGIRMKLEILSWATLLKKIDEFKFDAVSIGWSSGLFEDPEQLWHSRHAEEAGGSDLPGFKNAEVDRLIDSLPPVFDAEIRNQTIRRIDRIAYREVPYVLFWYAGYTRLLYKNQYGHPKTYLSKYGSAGDVLTYWWLDPVKKKALAEAEKNKKPLPAEPVDLHYKQLEAGQGK